MYRSICILTLAEENGLFDIYEPGFTVASLHQTRLGHLVFGSADVPSSCPLTDLYVRYGKDSYVFASIRVVR